MNGISSEVANTLAGFMVLASFLMMYQVRLPALLNVLGLHAGLLSLAVAWQACVQHAPQLYVAAVIALACKAVAIPVALRRIVVRLGIHRAINAVTGIAVTMLVGIGMVALSLQVMLPPTAHADPVTREDIALALSVVLLGLLMMVSRRNAVVQVAAFLSLTNGIDLAAAAAQGMPLLVELSIAFSVLIACLIIGLFLFRIPDPFAPADLRAADAFGGDRG